MFFAKTAGSQEWKAVAAAIKTLVEEATGESPEAAVRHGGRALVISALTTMAGFGFLGLSHYPALARMGLFTAVSLFLCLAASVSVLPALLCVLAPQRDATTDEHQ